MYRDGFKKNANLPNLGAYIEMFFKKFFDNLQNQVGQKDWLERVAVTYYEKYNVMSHDFKIYPLVKSVYDKDDFSVKDDFYGDCYYMVTVKLSIKQMIIVDITYYKNRKQIKQIKQKREYSIWSTPDSIVTGILSDMDKLRQE